jgi:methyl-accepting chemotaxis protein
MDTDADYTRRKGLRITAKVLMIVVVPLLLVSTISSFWSTSNQQKTAFQLYEKELRGIVENVCLLYELECPGDFAYEDEVLTKGSEILTGNTEIIDSLKENTGAEITFLYGNVRALTTVEDEDGNRVVGTTLDEDIANQVLKGDELFVESLEIAGEKYCGYYVPEENSDGEIVGMIFAGLSLAEVNKEVNANQRKMWGVNGVILVLAIIASALILLRIMSKLRENVEALDEVAKGNLNVQMKPEVLRRSDEIGEMARAVQTMVNAFREMLSHIHRTSGTLSSTCNMFGDSFAAIVENINGVNVAVEEIASGATSQATESSETSVQVTRMGDAIGATTEQIDQLRNNSERMKQFSESAENTFKQLSEINDETGSWVSEVKKQTELTNQSAMDIETATQLITDISGQTNLLSLNASIEAARAGENGKGFAVVAEEIRKLSEESRLAAEKISGIVQTLISNSNTSVETMNSMTEVMSHQNTKLGETRSMFVSLNEEIDSVTNAVTQIYGQKEILDDAKGAVLSSVTQLAAIAEENAASTEQTSASMEEFNTIIETCKQETAELVELANDLDESIAIFTL